MTVPPAGRSDAGRREEENDDGRGWWAGRKGSEGVCRVCVERFRNGV